MPRVRFTATHNSPVYQGRVLLMVFAAGTRERGAAGATGEGIEGAARDCPHKEA